MYSSYVLSQEEIPSRALQESLLGVAELHIFNNEVDDRRKRILTKFAAPSWEKTKVFGKEEVQFQLILGNNLKKSMQFKEEKYRVRYEQLHKDRIRNKGLSYVPGGLGGTVHCKLNIYQRVAQISNGTLLGKGQLFYWDGEMIIVWSLFLI